MMRDVEELLHDLRLAGKQAADWRGQYEYLTGYRKHLIALLMNEAVEKGAKSLGEQERVAYASEVYRKHLQAQKEAHINLANAEHRREEASLAIEIWRTQQADQRAERRAYGA